MYRFFSILALLPLSLLADDMQVGWLCRITLRQSRVTEIQNPNGTIGYVVNDTGNRYYLIKFFKTDSTAFPSLADLGYTENMQLDGTPMPQTVPGDYYLVTTPFVSLRVGADANFDTSSTRNIGPIYNSSAGVPYTSNGDGWYTGFNNNFDNASISPLQGQSGDKWINYSSSGTPQLSSSPTDGNHWQYDDSSGSWVLTSNGSSNGSTDLSSVITAIGGVQSQIQSDNLALRQALVDWLGANGNSWVRDCKMSLDDLKSLVSALGGNVDLIVQSLSSQSDILSSIDADIHDNGTYLSSIDSALVSANSKLSDINSTLTSFRNENRAVLLSIERLDSNVNANLSYLYNDYSEHRIWMYDYLDDIVSKLENINNTLSEENTADYPNFSLPDLNNQSSDVDNNLPFDYSSWKNESVAVFQSLQSWGQSPSNHFSQYDVFSNFLTTFLGSIPSVGTESHMFTFEVELPYIGTIQKSFDFSDYPAISLFRQLCLWVCYLFFALASFKLIHGSII